MKRNIILTSLILTAVLCLIMAPAVMAQQGQGFTPPTPESRVETLNKAVTLTADQQAKILKIYTDLAANAQQGGRGGFGGGFGGGLPADVEKVLTPDQVKKYAAYTLQQSVDRRITQIDEAVTLTADQKKKIVPILEKETKATTALMAEMRAQGENADRQAMMDKMTALRAETDKALESILTKDQLTKYSAMPRGFGRGGRGGQ